MFVSFETMPRTLIILFPYSFDTSPILKVTPIIDTQEYSNDLSTGKILQTFFLRVDKWASNETF